MAIKTILLMAQTLDGKIAKYADHFPDWTGKADKQLFVRETRQAGAIIMGSSMIITTGVKPLLFGFPALGIIGYLVSGVLGLWLIYNILRSRKF